VPLDLVDDLATALRIGGAPLADQQIVEGGIVHVTAIARLPRVVLAEEEAIGLEERREGSKDHRIELPQSTGGLIRAVFLLVQHGADAHRLEVLEEELHGVDEHRGTVGREADAGLDTVRIAGSREEPLGLGGVVAIVFRPLAELGDGPGPVGEGGGQGPVDGADALERRIDHSLAVDGEGDGLAYPDIAERRLVRSHIDEVHHVRRKLRRLEAGPALLERLHELHPIRAVEEGGEARGVVLVDEHLHPVEIVGV
jgi:hypothetical protein